METERKLADLLRHHDWFFEWSEDHKAFVRGSEERIQILNKLGEVPVGESMPLIYRYCPQEIFEKFMKQVHLHARKEMN